MPRTTPIGHPLHPQRLVFPAGLPLGLAPGIAPPGDEAVAQTLARVDDEAPAPA